MTPFADIKQNYVTVISVCACTEDEWAMFFSSR